MATTIFRNRRKPNKVTIIDTLKTLQSLKKTILSQRKTLLAKTICAKENVCPARHQLFMYARKTAKDKGLDSFGREEATLFLRKGENFNVIAIRNRLSLFDL